MIGSKDLEYVRATSVRHIADLLTSHGPRPQILAGGTDLLVDLRNGRRTPVPERLIDIKAVPDLQQIDIDEHSGTATIGAAVSLNRIVEHPWIRRHARGLAVAAASVGTYQIRNRATLIGNLCNASPAADAAPVLLALDASVRVVERSGARSIPLRDFFLGVRKTALTENAFATAVTIHVPSGARTAFLKQQRVRGHDLAIVNAGGAVFRGSNKIVLAIGSCAPKPVLLEPISTDNTDPKELVRHFCRASDRILCPIDDVRASAAYRRSILPVLIERLVVQLLADGNDRPRREVNHVQDHADR